MSIDKKVSYTAADTVPMKVLLDRDVLAATQQGIIPPIHIQLLPTNRCNLNCSFCSCDAREKTQEMALTDFYKIIDLFRVAGTKAATITGGGEPLMHPNIEDMLMYLSANNIKSGLVTNGLLLHKQDYEVLNSTVTWSRISNGDQRTLEGNYKRNLIEVVENTPNVDWAFSHVVSKSPNYEEIARVIQFANEYDFTHVRLVADLFEPDKVPLEHVQAYIKGLQIDDSKVIYQGRKEHTLGGNCFIGYLKPLIGPDCNVYACCGVQYALATPSRALPEELCLGSAFDLPSILAKSNTKFDGGDACVKCYYSSYNSLLGSMLKQIEHKEFL